jgi:histidinol-phosphatase (PHP family)
VRVNYHVHNRYSSDGRGTTEEVVQRAAELGFEEICLTNHVETLGSDGDWIVDFVEARERFEQVQREIETARRQFPKLRILLGAELEYRPEWIESLERLTSSVEFDFLIGSVHVVNGHNVSGGAAIGEYFKGKEMAEAYGRYFSVVDEMVEWGGFDVVGHFDLIKRFGSKIYGAYPAEAFEPQTRAILERMVRRGIGLEVNTSGVVQPPAEPYPGLPILRAAREAGVTTWTIGTDSHMPERLDQGWDVGLHLLQEAGVSEITMFSRRIRRNVAIAE